MYGRKPCLFVTVFADECHLNADITREGVRQFLDRVRSESRSLTWVVDRNQRGRFNKICFGDAAEEIPGFYW